MNQPSGGSVGKPEKQPRPSTAKSNDANKAPQSMPISSDDRVQPVLWPTLLSIGFSQLMVAIPVLWMLIDAVEHPKPLAFYIAALLLPPAGIAWTVLLFSKLRLYPAWGIYFASFFLLPFLLGVVLGIPWGISQEVFLLSTFSIGAGYYSGNVLVVYLEVLKLSRMSSVEYVAYVQQQKAEQEVEKAKEPARDNIALVFIITIGLGFVIMFSSVFPIYIYGKSFDVGTLMHPAALVTAGMMLVSVIAKRVLKIHPAIMFVLLGVAVVAVVIWVGFPGCMVIIPGLVGYWTAEAWFLAASGWAASIRARIAMQIIKVRHDK